MPKVMLINNDGAGFASYVEVEMGTTVEDLFRDEMGDASASDYLIRVNRQEAAADQVLNEGDRCTFTPKKIDGAI